MDLAAVWRLGGRTEDRRLRKRRISRRVWISTLNNAVDPQQKVLNPHQHQCVKYINHSLCFLAAGGGGGGGYRKCVRPLSLVGVSGVRSWRSSDKRPKVIEQWVLLKYILASFRDAV